MKTKNILLAFCTAAFLTGMASCDDFLDTMPDKRTDLSTPDKVRDILLSAYPDRHPTILFEFMSDNYEDNGDTYSGPMNLAIQAYHWEDPTGTDNDGPQGLWDRYYRAIATANQALEAIEALGTPEECLPYKGEALMCRAFGHFMLANTFCMAYNPQTASNTLGIPYIKEPEKSVGVIYDRGTLEEVYQNLNADIEEALPLLKNANFSIPLYHFNSKAAYAFAARFNLFYGKDYDKVIKYATEAIGENPTNVLRDLNGYDKFTNTTEWCRGYIDKDEPSNLMLLTTISSYGRTRNQRYGITQKIIRNQLVWSPFPGNVGLTVYNTVFHNNYMNYFVPKLMEIFEITDQIAQTGYPHIVIPIFTTDETLLCRAEAHVLKKEYDAAATDLSYWYMKKGIQAQTADVISDFYAKSSASTNAKPLNTGVTYEEKQVNMINAVLHARRVEGLHEGVRWLDIKRYGLSYEHNVYNEEPIKLEPNDPRKAVQIPSQVLAAPGNMTPNPR